MTKFPEIILYRGVTNIVEFDFSEFEFSGYPVVFTIKDVNTNRLITRSLNESNLDANRCAYIEFLPDDTKKMTSAHYLYDLVHHLEERLLAQCLPSKLTIKETVGGIQ